MRIEIASILLISSDLNHMQAYTSTQPVCQSLDSLEQCLLYVSGIS